MVHEDRVTAYAEALLICYSFCDWPLIKASACYSLFGWPLVSVAAISMAMAARPTTGFQARSKDQEILEEGGGPGPSS